MKKYLAVVWLMVCWLPVMGATAVGLDKGLRFQDGGSTTNVLGTEYVPTKTGRVTLGGANNENIQAAGVVSSNLTANAMVKIAPSGVKALTNAVAGTDYYAPGGQDVAIADGGTGQSTAAAGLDALSQSAEVSLASASTVNIGAAAGQNIVITGTTTITAFDTVEAGTWRRLRFAGALALTHNATTLILPNATANIITAAGDTCHAVSLGSGNWRIYGYQKADGTALVGASGGAPTDAHYVTTQTEGGLSAESNLGALTTGLLKITVSGAVATPSTAASGTDYAPATSGSAILKGNGAGGFSNTAQGTDYYAPGGTDVAIADGGTGQSTASAGLDALSQSAEVSLASASTVNIGAAAGQNIVITGTTTITAFDTVAAGTWRRLRFAGALALTHNATTLILPNATANIITAAGDTCLAVSLGSGNWRIYGYQKANGTALAGGAGTGDVVGPSGATDNALARYDTTTGKLIQNSGVALDDSQNMSGINTLTATNINLVGTGAYLVQMANGGNFTNAGNNVTLTNDIPYVFNSNVTVNAAISLGSQATATTPAAGDNDTSVATTAFVQSESVKRQTFSNAGASVTAGNDVIEQTGTMSASRALTLAAANAYTAGKRIFIADVSGTVTSAFTIVVTRAGSDTIDGGTTFTLGTAYGSCILETDGTSKWTVIASSGAWTANAFLLGGGAGAAPATTTTGSGVVTAVGNAVNTSGGLLTYGHVSFTDSFEFIYPHRVDGSGATVLTNDYTSGLNGLVTFSGSNGTNTNYALFRVGMVPSDLSTGTELVLKDLHFRVSGTDTGQAQFSIAFFQPAESAGYSPSDFTALSTYISFNKTPSTVAANDEFFVQDVTLTGWAAALTARRSLTIGIARIGGDANNDTWTLTAGKIDYVRVQ